MNLRYFCSYLKVRFFLLGKEGAQSRNNVFFPNPDGHLDEGERLWEAGAIPIIFVNLRNHIGEENKLLPQFWMSLPNNSEVTESRPKAWFPLHGKSYDHDTKTKRL